MIRLLGFLILMTYFLVIAVAITEGPLISIQSALLGLIGLVSMTLILSAIAKYINLVDEPDGDRKRHEGSIPLVGGIMLYISMLYGIFVYGVNQFYTYILLSLLPILFMGIFDGLKGFKIKPTYRVIAQIIASWIVILLTDVYVKDLGNLFGNEYFDLGNLGIPFTIFSVVGICNAFNMIDGKDGLLGSVSLIIMSSLLFLLFLNGVIYQWAQILIASLLVYLAFNLSLFGQNRKIFLGDHGSTGLGHIIAWSLIYLSQETQYITPVSALWFVLLPLTDALLTFFRRLRSSRSLFSADRYHFHDILSDMGLSDRFILFIFSIITLISCAFAVFANLNNLTEYNLLLGYLTMLVILALLDNSRRKL